MNTAIIICEILAFCMAAIIIKSIIGYTKIEEKKAKRIAKINLIFDSIFFSLLVIWFLILVLWF